MHESTNEKHQHLAPFLSATSDLVRLNSKWQEQLKTEKERVRRNLITGNNEKTDDASKYDTINDAVVTVMHPTQCNTNLSADLKSILPVASVVTSSYPTQTSIAEEFTLNKEQRAAFMIITSHLDGDRQRHAGIVVM